MSRRVTMRDIAAQAGVSLATVSNALNGRLQHVSEETAQRVLKVAKELGYAFSQKSRKGPKEPTHLLGMVVAGLTPLFSEAVTSVIAVAGRFGFDVILCNNTGNEQNDPRSVRALVTRGVDGIIFCSSSVYTSSEALEIARDADIPFVVINRPSPIGEGLSLLIDNRLGGYLATSHVIEMGHRQVACIHLPTKGLKTSAGHERLQGYLEALAAHGIAPHPGWIRPAIGTDDVGIGMGKAIVGEMLSSDAPPTAVVCGSDYLAFGALKAAQEAGLRIPDDFAVVGYDDTPIAKVTTPTLTTVRQPMAEAGTRAVEALINHLWKGDSLRSTVRLQPELVVRGSTAAFVASEPLFETTNQANHP